MLCCPVLLLCDCEESVLQVSSSQHMLPPLLIHLKLHFPSTPPPSSSPDCTADYLNWAEPFMQCQDIPAPLLVVQCPGLLAALITHGIM